MDYDKLSITEFAKTFNISRHILQYYITTNKIKYIKIGERKLIPKSEINNEVLKRYLKKKEKKERMKKKY